MPERPDDATWGQSGSETPAGTYGEGARIGRFVIVGQIGQGGMGTVYAAYDPKLDRKVALKLLHPDASPSGAPSSDRHVRLLREAQAMARLAHPHVIAVHEVGTFRDQVFLAMEFVDGCTLTQWLHESPRPRRKVLAVFKQAALGLAAAHAAGIVHRDFKPDNVLVGCDGRVRVVDFGLARATAEAAGGEAAHDDQAAKLLSTPLTRTGAIQGTPAYMAAEQHRGAAADQRSDQFSFCVALYEALHDEHPFGGETPQELAQRVVDGHIREAPRGARAPRWLRRVLLRGLQPAPGDRYPSMDALLRDLARDPAAARRWWAVMGATAVCIVAAAFAYRSIAGQRKIVCSDAEQESSGVWNARRKALIHKAFAGTGKPYAERAFMEVAHALDDYSRSWVAMHTDACQATHLRGEQSAAALDLRMQCLDQRLHEEAALIDVFAAADASVVEKAVEAARTLTPLADCADVRTLALPVPPPSDAPTRARVEALRKQLAKATALGAARKYSEALAAVTPLGAQAHAIGYRPLEAEVLVLQGWMFEKTGDAKHADEVLLEAIVAAQAGRQDPVVARAATYLTWSKGVSQAQPQEARPWGRLAEATNERLGNPPDTKALLLLTLGTMSRDAGDFETARVDPRGAGLLREDEARLQRRHGARGDLAIPSVRATAAAVPWATAVPVEPAARRAPVEREVREASTERAAQEARKAWEGQGAPLAWMGAAELTRVATRRSRTSPAKSRPPT